MKRDNFAVTLHGLAGFWLLIVFVILCFLFVFPIMKKSEKNCLIRADLFRHFPTTPAISLLRLALPFSLIPALTNTHAHNHPFALLSTTVVILFHLLLLLCFFGCCFSLSHAASPETVTETERKSEQKVTEKCRKKRKKEFFAVIISCHPRGRVKKEKKKLRDWNLRSHSIERLNERVFLRSLRFYRQIKKEFLAMEIVEILWRFNELGWTDKNLY